MKYPLRKIFQQPFAYCFFSMLAISINGFSQKSVYDVVPGSGPSKPERKKTSSGGSVYDVVPGSGPSKPHRRRSSDEGVYDVVRGERDHHHEGRGRRGYRKNLPPGQAKKVYGGSARDYAPGHVKKRHHHHGRHHD